VLLTLNDTGTGDEKQLGAANGDVLYGEGHGGIIRFCEFRGFKGFEVAGHEGRAEQNCSIRGKKKII
jgi:hypothetical protein